MPRGGARAGAGRKPGNPITKTQKTALNAIRDGKVLPLDVMLREMRKYYYAWEDAPDEQKDDKDLEKAVAYAVQAAPFLHPKLANVQHGGDKENPLTFNIVTNVEREDEPKPVNDDKTLELTADPHDGSYH